MGEGRGGRKGEPGKVGEEMEGEGRVEGWGGEGREIDVELWTSLSYLLKKLYKQCT